MIIFLYGPDSYRLRQNSYSVLDNYRKKHPGGIFFKFDLSDINETIKAEDAIKSGSLFGEVKLIVLKSVFSNKAGAERMGELIKSQNLLNEKDTVLLFIENQEEKELFKNKKLFDLLTGKDPAQSNSADHHQKGRTLGGASNMVRNVRYLNGENLAKWIKGEFSLRKCSAEPDAIRELVVTAGNESWILVNEIEKLCNFSAEGGSASGGKVNNAIKKEDVVLLGFKKTDLNIFDFVDAIAGKNKVKAYEMLFKEIKSGRDPYYLLTMMVYGFRNMLAVKDLSDRGVSLGDITRTAKLHPFVAKKTYQSVGKFSLTELKDFYGQLLNLDTSSKSGTLNLTDSLFGFILN